MGYTPVFDSVFHGTLCGRWPALPVWLTILPMADKNGHINMTIAAMSALTGWPQDLLKQAITELCSPDPESRSNESDGRRLELLDPENRSWGWRVVNHGKYREKARKAAYDSERTASGNDAERKRQSRDVPRSPDASRALPLSDSDANTDTNPNPSRTKSALPEPVPRGSMAKIRKCYPGEHPEASWLQAERLIEQILDRGEATTTDLVALVSAYALQQQAKGNTTHLYTPLNFFGKGYWKGPFPVAKPPETAAERIKRLNPLPGDYEHEALEHVG